MVICLEQGADLHMAQLMPLPLTDSCFSKIQIGFTFLVPAHPGSPGKRAVKRVCVCVCDLTGDNKRTKSRNGTEKDGKRVLHQSCPSSCNYSTDEMYIYYNVVFSRRGKRLNYSSGEVYKAKTRAE